MKVAKEEAFDTGYGAKAPVGVVFVKKGKVIVGAAVGNDYHLKHGCERQRLGIPSGLKYELCPGCDYSSHSEPKAVLKAKVTNLDIKGADAYLFGQWWCCEPCSNKMVDAGIREIYLLKDSEKYFNRDLPECKHGNFAFFYELIEQYEKN